MAELSGAQIVARILKEEGLDFIAGVHGGNVFQLLMATDALNIKMLHMRVEPSAVYLMDGWSKVTRRPGVCFFFGSVGTLNTVAAAAHSFMTRSPVIIIGGGRASSADGWTHHQLGYEAEVFKPVTKWSKRIEDWGTVSYHFQKAFRDAVSYPPGPIFLEFPGDIQLKVGDEAGQLGYLSKEKSAVTDKGEANPAVIERAVRLLLEAEKPIVMGGSGIWWSQATGELKEFVELLRIPLATRELALGTVDENHPLAFRGRYAGALFANADVIAIFGQLMGMMQGYGQPPLYKHKGTKYILVSESEEELDTRMPTEIRILANPKQVLRQMIDCAKDLIKEPPERSAWLGALARYKEAYQKAQREQSEKLRNDKPINPYFLAQEVADFLDDSATIILDGFMFPGFMSNRFAAKFPGHYFDAAGIIGVGHSVGMAMGVQLARPGKQVLGLLGDGGMGITGFDLETAARYKIPAVWLLFNNSGWMNTTMQNPDYKGILGLPIKDSYGMLKDIRYDKIVEELSCHGEFVTEPEQIRPALERAFNSGKPALVNVIPDDRVHPPFLMEGRLGRPPQPSSYTVQRT